MLLLYVIIMIIFDNFIFNYSNWDKILGITIYNKLKLKKTAQ